MTGDETKRIETYIYNVNVKFETIK